MVGGRAGVSDERVYRFNFPERPGALMNFLSQMGSSWNISMFHYRNHGAAWGRVLVGFQAGNKDQRELQAYLKKIGYRFWEESENPAYQMFLR